MCGVDESHSFTTDIGVRRMAAESILEDISEALESWAQRILDIETKIKRTTGLRENILDALQRQVLDGLIFEQDSRELEYVGDLWISLYKTFMCRCVGADFADRDVLTYLLELFELKQISKEFFMQIALQLCRSDDSNV